MADTKRFLDDFHQRTQCAVRDYRGDIPAGHKLPIEEFRRLLTQQQTTSASTAAVADYLVKRSPILIVDVRSPIQFGIASLAHSPLVHEVYSSLPPAVDDEDASASGGVALINLPLAQLQSDDRLVDQLLQRASTSLGGGTLCVLCRRGVDSTVATRLLLERVAAESLSGTGKSTSIRIWNVEGGLTAWHQDVDPTFPMY
jgi:rhodanese-related sulfurtransferase